MPLGLDKTHKKEKKDRRFAQFNLILGAAADAGKREFNFTTRDKTTTYPWSSLSKISETTASPSQTRSSSSDLCCSATPWRTWSSSRPFDDVDDGDESDVSLDVNEELLLQISDTTGKGGRALFWTSIIFFLYFDVWHAPQKRTQNSLKFFDNLHKISLSKKIRVGEEALSFLLLSPIIVAPSCSFSFSSSYSHSCCSYCHVSAHHQYAFI